MSASAIRRRLANLHAYAGLRLALDPGDGGTRNPLIRKTLNAIGVFLQGASTRDLQSRGRELEALLERGTKPRKGLVPARAPELIGRDFIVFGRERDVWRHGVPYGWLERQFKPPILALPADMPGHIPVGLAVHAGSVAIEEGTLLEDSYFFALMTERAYESMFEQARSIPEPVTAVAAQDSHRLLTDLNLNVGTLARITVVTAAGFVESFINSVGVSHAARHPKLESTVVEQLHGKWKGRFLSLETKLERFPMLIRQDHASPIRISDEMQRQEPFRRFLSETKEVRDAAMHYAPGKAPIICTPQEWRRRANSAVEDAIEVARQFWSACYPLADQPRYLYGLDSDSFRTGAKRRIEALEGCSDLAAT